MELGVDDYLQSRYSSDLTGYSLMVDCVLYALVVYYYYNDTNDTKYTALKLAGMTIVLRYIFSFLTEYKNKTHDKRYFQINLYLVFFIIITMMLYRHYALDMYVTISMIIGYTIISSAVGNNFTTDNITSMMMGTLLVLGSEHFGFS